MTVPRSTAINGSLILVVEDEPKIAQLLVDYLVQASYPTHHIGNGEEVVSWVCDHQPRLILLDGSDLPGQPHGQ